MKTGKRSLVFTLGAALVAWLALVPSARAGAVGPLPLTITVNGNIVEVSGGYADTRNSSDPSDELRCGVYVVKGKKPLAWCSAYAGANKILANCSTYDPGMVQAVASMNSDSAVYFSYSTTDRNSECLQLDSATGSIYAPKTK